MRKPKKKEAGKYRVGQKCIGCMLCPEIAPDNLKTDPETGNPYVFKQPAGEKEMDCFREAVEICPTNALVKDVSNRMRRKR